MRIAGLGPIIILFGMGVLLPTSAQQRTPPPSSGLNFDDLLAGLKDPSRWPMYSGDFTAQRHSPLTQITPANVNRLTSQWTFQTDLSPYMTTGRGGGLQSVPLEFDGVIYMAGPMGRVFAIDARSGRQIWQYRRDLPSDVAQSTTRGETRGLAILGNRIFVGTLDAHIIALDTKTGRVVWDTVMEDYHKFFTVTSAPLIVRGNQVITGTSGGDRGAYRFFIDAYDANTGKRLWRWYAVPGPGEPGSETWPNEEAMSKGGGATWTVGAYDPELNLIYWGTGNPYGAPDTRLGDNLYTASLVALDAGTGKLKWYYQIVPHDIHDYDATQTPVLADVTIAGQPRKVVMLAEKVGYLYVLDRANGKFLTAHPLSESSKNWAKEIAPDGRPVLNKDEGTSCLPDIHGAANYWPPSYDPMQNLFILTVHEVCEIFNLPQKGVVSASAGSWTVGGAGYAALRAVDPLSGQQKWEYRYPPSNFGLTGVSPTRAGQGISLSGGVTSTASNLVFSGDNEGNFIAFDSTTGKPLWHYQCGSPLWGSAPVTYMLDGRQHVVVSAGLTLMDFALSDLR
jgi:alcohol dehydrogenase (cytochrome c)